MQQRGALASVISSSCSKEKKIGFSKSQRDVPTAGRVRAQQGIAEGEKYDYFSD